LAGANTALFDTLYKNCNGLRIGRGKFVALGFLTGNQSVGVPWDIDLANEFSSSLRPASSLAVGTSRKYLTPQKYENFNHTIQKEHEIHVTAKADFSVVLRRYFTVEGWLKAEVDRA